MPVKNKRPILGMISFAILVVSFGGIIFRLAGDSSRKDLPHDEHVAVALDIFADVIRAIFLFLFGLGCSLAAGATALLRGERRLLPLLSIIISLLTFGLFVVLLLGRH